MSSHIAKKEFDRWISSLKSDDLSSEEKHIIWIVAEHFEAIYKLGTAGGQRAKKIADIIKKIEPGLPGSLPEISKAQSEAAEEAVSITEITIGPFRGFGKEEKFTFDKLYTFLFGPNGSGKSSLSEGIELALLGSIEEANSKRIPLASYIKNENCGSGVNPKALGKFTSGEVKEIKPNDKYRFSLLERNRIEAFARISATTAQDKEDRIATLFGLKSFSDFVGEFTDNFEKYLQPLENQHLESAKTAEKSITLEQDSFKEKQALIKAHPESIAKIAKDLGISETSTVQEVKIHLMGATGNDGALQKAIDSKGEAIPIDIEASCISVANNSLKLLLELQAKAVSVDNKLSESSSQVDFKRLYEAIQAISEPPNKSPIFCPACTTPLDKVTKDPFEHARVELQKTKEISELQDQVGEITTKIESEIEKANTAITESIRISKICDSSEFALNTITKIPAGKRRDVKKWASTLMSEIGNIEEKSQKLAVLSSRSRIYNAALKGRREKAGLVGAEISKLQAVALVLTKVLTTKESLDKDVSEFESKLQKLKETHKLLSEKSVLEQKIVETNNGFFCGYNAFMKRIAAHLESLAPSLATGLADLSLKFYNDINKNDAEFHKLESVVLPRTANERIRIKFKNEKNYCDALHILSEGHIKALGLSLLLAKVVQLDLKFIVFDDIVNSIDDDHRSSVAEILLKDPLLKDRQQIITCHGEMFIKRLEDVLGESSASRNVKNYSFKAADLIETRGIIVSIGDSLHHLSKARACFGRGEIKATLSHCRTSLESQAEKLWKKISLTGKMLSVQMRSANTQPDLASVLMGILKELESVAGTEKIVAGLKEIRSKYNNMLLNKGTHQQEDLPEFDRSDVNNCLTVLSALDEEVNKLKIISTAA